MADENPFDELASSVVLSIDAVLDISDPATYLVCLAGDSMEGAGMYDGDLMVVSKGIEPERGHIVIAVVNGDVMVKRVDYSGYHPVLRSANPNYLPRHVMEGNKFSIWGVVTHTIHAISKERLMPQKFLKLNQQDALKDLEAALRSMKRAGLVMVGIDGTLLASVCSEDLEQDMLSTSACEAILERRNNDCPITRDINHYGCYRDSGAA